MLLKPGSPEYYKARLTEARENFSRNSKNLSVAVPKFLHNEWKRLKEEGVKISLSKVMNEALHFALFGPHKLADPMEGLRDAFENYSTDAKDREDIVKEMVTAICSRYNIKVNFDS